MCRHSGVYKRLNTEALVVANDSKAFQDGIRKFISPEPSAHLLEPEVLSDSDDLSDMSDDEAADKDVTNITLNPEGNIALWPLVRKVSVACNAQALASGAVLVDLPGIKDSNAARNKIAKDYLKKCHYVWIVSPVHRAVSDKVAKCLCSWLLNVRELLISIVPRLV